MSCEMMGEPRPVPAAEMLEALDAAGTLGSDCTACIIDDRRSEPKDSPFYGWSANVRNSDGEVFSTVAFKTWMALVAALRAAGIDDIRDEEGDMF